MKKFVLGFLTCFAVISLSLLGYVGNLLYVAKPGFYVSKEAISLSTEQKLNVFTALIKLSDITNSIGREKYSSLFLGSAGVLGRDAGLTAIESKFILTKAIALAKIYEDQTGDISPFMESRFTLALHLKDNGEIDSAKQIVFQSLAYANSKDPQNYWIGSFDRLRLKL